MIELIPGQLYRRQELHDRYGGQRQGGISMPKNWPVIFLFSSPRGEEFGYKDGWTEDGFYIYTGEGQKGDMTLTRGNAAIARHVEEGKDLHLFESGREGIPRGWVRYVGQMVCVGYEWTEGPDQRGCMRKVIRFRLMPVGDLTRSDPLAQEIERTLRHEDLHRLRDRALERAERPLAPREARRQILQRSQAIRQYALRRAGGSCEACGSPAPFQTADGEPFLEVHHIRRLSDGGPDHPEWVAAICPNCHRRAHYSKDAEEFNRELARRIQEKEKQLRS